MKNLSLFAKYQIIQWLAFISITEFFVFFFAEWQVAVFLILALVFFIRFLSIMLHLYSKKRISVNVDLLSLCLSLTLAAIASGLKPTNILMLILAPILALPHIIYIIVKD